MLSHFSSFGILLMAGKGTRYSELAPKQYLPYEGKPLFLHAYEAMASSPEIEAILCVIGAKDEGLAKFFIDSGNYAKPTYFVIGGTSRTESVHNALKHLLANGAKEESVLLIHDAARPHLEESYIKEGIAKAKERGASITCYPSSDSVAIGNGQELTRYMNRQEVYILGTPQTFTLDVLEKAFEKKDPEKEYTDDGSLVLDTLGIKPLIVRGKRSNVKITFKEDAA